jgi:PhzF family phenazine biosynthesis protein
MGVPIYHVDAFTNKRFSGNPAGVCLLPVPADEGWMQNVAREMNMSETAFLYEQEDGFNLRWFTPAAEVELCGHATLASAHVLWEEGYLEPEEPICFHTLSGLLTAKQAGDWIELDFPATPAEPATPSDDLVKALGIKPEYVGQNQFDYLVEVGIEETVRAMQPDFSLLKQVTTRGVIVTSPASSPGYDFISRFFAPAVGIDEDPVTGSAHCCLGPFWSKRFGKRELAGYQASPRGGTVRVRVEGERVMLGGQAVTILRGKLI